MSDQDTFFSGNSPLRIYPPLGNPGVSADDGVRLPKRRRSRDLDEPILRYIAHFHVVTSFQVLYSFFIHEGKGPDYGYRLLKELRERALLESTPIYSDQGPRSMHYLTLTPAGYHLIGERVPKIMSRGLSRHMLLFYLQNAEMRLQRDSEGWQLARSDAAFEIMRKWALAHFRGDRILTESEIMARTRIEKIPATPLPVSMLVHPDYGWIRLILPAHRGKSFKRLLESLPSFHLFPRIPFELVCADADLIATSLDLLKRHAKRNKFKYSVSLTPHFNSRPYPKDAPKAVSIPQRTGSKNPIEMPSIKGP